MKLNDLLKVLSIEDIMIWQYRPEFAGTPLENIEIYDYRLTRGADRYEKIKDYLNYEVDSISEDSLDKQLFITIKGQQIA